MPAIHSSPPPPTQSCPPPPTHLCSRPPTPRHYLPVPRYMCHQGRADHPHALHHSCAGRRHLWHTSIKEACIGEVAKLLPDANNKRDISVDWFTGASIMPNMMIERAKHSSTRTRSSASSPRSAGGCQSESSSATHGHYTANEKCLNHFVMTNIPLRIANTREKSSHLEFAARIRPTWPRLEAPPRPPAGMQGVSERCGS